MFSPENRTKHNVKLDFRVNVPEVREGISPSESFNEMQKVLYCDFFKSVANTDTTNQFLIEEPEVNEVVLTPNKRLDQCFIKKVSKAKDHASLFCNVRKELINLC